MIDNLPMRVLLAVLAAAIAQAQTATEPAVRTMPPLERLYARPYVWGTEPSELKWSKNGQTLLFLWNTKGDRFRDLYAWDPRAKKLSRLTDLEGVKDELNLTDDEQDGRLKRHEAPPAGLSSFDVSNDGKLAAFSYKDDLYVAHTDASRAPVRLTKTKAAETSPKFSPDAARLASIRGGQLHVQDLASGQLWQAAHIEGGTLTGYEWSPDGKTFVCCVRKGPVRQLPLPNYSGQFVTARPFNRTIAGDEIAEVSLMFVPGDGGAVRPIDRGGDKWYIDTLEWSPDSSRVLVAHLSPDWKKRQVVIVDAASAKGRVAFEETDSRWVDYGSAGWSPDGKDIVFTSEREGHAHLYRVPGSGGEPVQLTRGNYEIRTESFGNDPEWVGNWIYFSSTEAATSERQFYRVSPDGTRKERLSSEEGLHIGYVSESGNNVAMLRATEKQPFDLWVNEQRVTTSPRPEFHDYPWPDVRYVQFPSRGDKKLVSAKMLLPPGYPKSRSGGNWPAIVYIHGAGIATSVLKQWGSYNELRYVYNAYLANRGYVVLDIDYRGSTGYGRDWRTDVYLHLGGKDLDDILGGVDYLRGLGSIDMTRLGAWGVSYGGFLTSMALFQSPGTFRAGSAWAGVYDWENYHAFYTPQRLNTPASNPEAYRRSSPIHFSGNLKDKLLIVHGMVDDNVLFQDAVQLTGKLVQEGKDFSHIFYPLESHGFVRDETWIDALRRTTDWFERHLK
jgi:dipeptidyl aminopeptidase/acylaminoacyl peptidase